MRVDDHLATIHGLFGRDQVTYVKTDKQFILELLKRIEALEADNRETKFKVDTMWDTGDDDYL